MTAEEITALAESIVHGAQERYVAELTHALVADLMDGVFGGTGQIALDTLSRANRERLQTILMQHRDEISTEVMSSVQDALARADNEDVAALEAYYGASAVTGAVSAARAAGASSHVQELIHQTARGLSEVIARQNIAMATAAEQTWYQVAGDAIAAKNQGLKPRDRIIAEAVSRLSDAGITVIDYKSGISNMADVAIRRHIVTQASQAGGDMTLARLEAYGHELVITSAHYGARPSHALWQGKPCCRTGAKTVDGVHYPDFRDLTGYGTVGGLKGVNCRHSFSAYFPGVTKLPDLGFPRETRHFGMSSGDYYDATQRQRELERRIRATKRKIADMEDAGLGLESPSYVQKRLLLGRQQQTLREHVAENRLVRQPKREKAYGVASQPRALRTNPAARSTSKTRIDTIGIGRSVGAKAVNYDILMKNGEMSRFVEGSEIDVLKVFAGYGSSTELRKRLVLAENYGGDPDKWFHASGEGWMFDPADGKIRRGEVHWMEEESIGRKEFVFKRWRDGR